MTAAHTSSPKKALAFVLVALCATFVALCLTAQTAHASSLWICNIKTANGTMVTSKAQAKKTNLDSSSYTIYPSGDKSGNLDFKAIHLCMNKCTSYKQNWDHRNKKITIKLVKGKTYYIDQTLKLYNNVTFIANGATIKQVTKGKGIFINAYYKDSSDIPSSLKKTGGYSRGKNITINGGTYVTTGQCGKKKGKKNGWYMGYSTFLFMHCNKIRIKNVTITNNYNGHYIELAGCKNCRIEYSTFNGTYKGDSGNEVIQLDACVSKSNSPQGSPWDGTATRTTLIDHCTFNVPSCPKGIGTNQQSSKSYYRIKATNNTFKVKKYALCINNCSKGSASGNKFKSGKVYVSKNSNFTLGKAEKKKKA